MDELSDIEARHDATAENLRRAFGAPVGGEPPAFAALLNRLAGRSAGRGREPAKALGHAHGSMAAEAAMRGAWSRPFAET